MNKGLAQEMVAWAAQWVAASVIPEEPCRGCLAEATVQRTGHLHTTIRARAADQEVRETEAGAYCVACFMALPPCPVCGVEPTSHAEYPCVRCEVGQVVEACVAGGGRAASPTYRGWSIPYRGLGQDNGRSGRKRLVERRG